MVTIDVLLLVYGRTGHKAGTRVVVVLVSVQNVGSVPTKHRLVAVCSKNIAGLKERWPFFC